MTRLGFADARRVIVEASCVLEPEAVDLSSASGRIVAGDVRAVDDYPRFDCSAMDGYALTAADTAQASLANPLLMLVNGLSQAGALPSASTPGAACPISTGAIIPDGCDAVVAREHAELIGDQVSLVQPIVAGRNIRRRGEDALAQELVARRGDLLSPTMIGALACFGVSSLPVIRRPRLAMIATGDELGVPPGAEGVAVHDANGPMIMAMSAALGLPTSTATAADRPDQLGEAITYAGYADIVVTTGGVSVGDHDHLPQVLADLGATVHFHGVAMRPGKPVLFATLPGGALFFGLPGNPVAALVGFRFFVTAAIRRMLALPFEEGTPATLPGPPPRVGTTILKARVAPGDKPCLQIADDQRSHTMRPLISCNAWVVVEASDETHMSSRWFCLTPTLAG